MGELVSLWLPILAAAGAVFVASFLAWMVLPHHKADFKKLSNEDGFLSTVRKANAEPGVYMFPYCEPSDLKDPEVKKRYEAGPHGLLSMWPGPPSMGKNLSVTFIFYIVVGIFVGYIGTLALAPGAGFMEVFQVTGAAAVMAYALGFIPNGIWFGRSFRSLAMDFIDNFVYGIITGLIFAALWPKPVS